MTLEGWARLNAGEREDTNTENEINEEKKNSRKN